MGFILDGLDTEAYDRSYQDRELLVRLLGYFRPYTGRMILIAIAITLNSMAGTAGPILISKGIDLLRAAQRPSDTTIVLLAGGVLLLGVSAWVFNYIQQLVSARVVGNVVLKLREDVFDATIRHDLSFYDDPGYYDQLHRARIDALSRPAALIENAGTLLQSFITLAAMGGVLLTFGIGIPLLLAFSTLPALWVVLRKPSDIDIETTCQANCKDILRQVFRIACPVEKVVYS